MMTTKKKNTIFRDSWGNLRLGWEIAAALGGVVAVLLVLIVLLVAAAKPFQEASCNQTAAQYGVSGDYRLWSDQCWLTTVGGTVVSESNYRAFERVEGIAR